ncbi:hypothetical protein NPIL_553411 [Nephila pilipes]|uniref:Uncharacterized protein n=1 Tax=Nephila pilipes TaxID=299642 RepID=A0A8X6TVM3_NEPPI|nr:hypothetical protein NPIL_553411 [Nephila pilipes]
MAVAYILQSNRYHGGRSRGYSPWIPAGDMGTDQHENHILSLGFAEICTDRGSKQARFHTFYALRRHPTTHSLPD